MEIRNTSDFSRSLLTKLKTWSIEREWRIISEKTKFRFMREALVEIVFGLMVPESTMDWFKQFSENVYYMHAPIHRLRIKGSRLIKVDEWDDEVV